MRPKYNVLQQSRNLFIYRNSYKELSIVVYETDSTIINIHNISNNNQS